jgi:hypothetical protein
MRKQNEYWSWFWENFLAGVAVALGELVVNRFWKWFKKKRKSNDIKE